jgi:NAD(P)-dependent dehydrogenase (short-subunit alcohol dehydrogenase family)
MPGGLLMMNASDRTLIVTGASMGIGRALAVGLAEEGFKLVLNARSRDLLEAVAGECRDKGVEALVVPGDVSMPETVLKCVSEAASNGDMFGFIHVAGVLNPGPFLWELGEDSFSRIMDVSLKASYLLIRHAVPRLLSRGQGLAVFFGSGAAEITQPGISAYCAAKAAEEHLARQLAAETSDIVTFVYRPGIVDTGMQEQAREARGGASAHLHRVFRPWKERGELISPERSAEGLITLLRGDLKGLHGKVIRQY